MKTRRSKLLKWFLYIVTRPFVYLARSAFVFIDILQNGLNGDGIIDDSLKTNVRLIGTEAEPVLMFESTFIGTLLFAGFESDGEPLEQVIRHHWRRHLEQPGPQQPIYDSRYDFVGALQFIFCQQLSEEEIRHQEEQRAIKRAEQVKAWLDAGANVNATAIPASNLRDKPYRGFPLLMLALITHENRIVRLLVSHKADVNYNVSSLTPLDFARNNQAMVDLLRQAGAKDQTPAAS